LNIIVAVDERGGFAKERKIPWYSKQDFEIFKSITAGGTCIMGRNTYEEILTKSKKEDLLPGRTSIILSRRMGFTPKLNTIVVSDLKEALHQTSSPPDKTFILGGEKLFTETLYSVNNIYMSIIKGNFNCDQFFLVDKVHEKFNIVYGKEYDDLYFVQYRRKPSS